MSEQTRLPDTAHPSRRIRLRCPLCDHTSPVCDQLTDVRRDLLARWWDAHLRADHRPAPIIERAPDPGAEGTGAEVAHEHNFEFEEWSYDDGRRYLICDCGVKVPDTRAEMPSRKVDDDDAR